jgi:hypothetical protein
MSQSGYALSSKADHTVVLDYGPEGILPLAKRAEVRSGQTVSFALGNSPIPGAKLRVKFSEPQFFSAPEFTEGDGPVTVTTTLAFPHVTDFACELVMTYGYKGESIIIGH